MMDEWWGQNERADDDESNSSCETFSSNEDINNIVEYRDDARTAFEDVERNVPNLLKLLVCLYDPSPVPDEWITAISAANFR